MCLFSSTLSNLSADLSTEQITEKSAKATPDKMAVEAMQSFYNEDTGLWKQTGWWNGANVLTTLIRYEKFSGDRDLLPVIENTYQKARTGKFKGHEQFHSQDWPNPEAPVDFINVYNDDEGWWGLAWIEAWELTDKKEYLDTTVSIFTDMTKAWSEQNGGGIFWKKNETYKASIANSLFALLALRLHANGITEKINGRTPLEWAESDWKWFREAGLIDREKFQINDGIEESGRIRRDHWTYNQGVVIAVLVELYHLKKDEASLELAQNIAEATIKHQSRDGILHERNEPDMGADGVQFKGVFMRHLYSLYMVAPKPEYRRFIKTNADAVWSNRNPRTFHMGGVWSEPTKKANAGEHSSALDAIVTRLGIEKNAEK